MANHRLIAALLSILLAASGCTNPPAETADAAKDSAAPAERNVDWPARAMDYARKAATVNPKLAPSPYAMVASQCAFLGRFDQALEALGNEPEGPSQYMEIGSIAGIAASNGQPPQAIQIAQTVHDPRFRSIAINQVVFALADRHDFRGALESVKLLTAPIDVVRAGYRIARGQAEAGEYDAALETSKMIPANSAEEAKAKADFLEDLAKCRREGRHDLPPARKDPRQPLCESLRELIGVAGDLRDLPAIRSAEAWADQQRDIDLQGSRWRQIAWSYYRCGDRASCRKAMAQAETLAAKSGQPLARAVNDAALADLHLELGERDAAQSLVDPIGRLDLAGGRSDKPPGEDPFKVLVQDVDHMFDTTLLMPYLVDVMVRCGDIDAAFHFVERLPKGDSLLFGSMNTSLWLAVGSSCAAAGRVDEIAKRIDGLPSDEARMYLCLGVVDGLNRRPPATVGFGGQEQP
jgi:hypothetical protein